jgi:hypothetical protein
MSRNGEQNCGQPLDSLGKSRQHLKNRENNTSLQTLCIIKCTKLDFLTIGTLTRINIATDSEVPGCSFYLVIGAWGCFVFKFGGALLGQDGIGGFVLFWFLLWCPWKVPAKHFLNEDYGELGIFIVGPILSAILSVPWVAIFLLIKKIRG